MMAYLHLVANKERCISIVTYPHDMRLLRVVGCFGEDIEVFGTFVAERGGDVAACVMILESAFFTYSLRFVISIIIPAPYGIKRQIIKTS